MSICPSSLGLRRSEGVGIYHVGIAVRDKVQQKVAGERRRLFAATGMVLTVSLPPDAGER
jgi:hypothetical protein